MQRIHGYVLEKETNSGIANLVVAAYDSEVAIRDLVSEHPRTNVLSSQFMDKLGKRIGSVLTDSEGKFILTREDLHFEGVESRPDLLLIVFAPEDVMDAKRPYVLPPEERILYISSVPRNDAGAEEAYVIRLLQSQLEEFNIAINAGQNNSNRRTASSDQLISDIESSQMLRQKLQKNFSPRIKDQHEKNVAQKNEAKKVVKNFSAIPISMRKHPMLLKDPKDLETLQKKSVTDGLDRLKDYKGNLRLNLTTKELRSLGLKVNKDGEVSGKVDTNAFTEKIKTLVKGVDLVRKQGYSPSAVSPEELLKKYTTNPPEKNQEKKPIRKPRKK